MKSRLILNLPLFALCFSLLFLSADLKAQIFGVSKTTDAPIDAGIYETAPGFPITYTISFNASGVNDLDINDVLPPELVYQAGSVSVGGAASGCTITEPSGAGGTLNINCPGGPVNGIVTITYVAEVGNIDDPNMDLEEFITNDVDVTGNDGAGTPYSSSASATVKAERVTIQKNVLSTGPFTPGSIVDYEICYQFSEYTTDWNDIDIEDAIPDGMMFLGTTNFTISTSSTSITPVVNGNNIRWDFGQTYTPAELTGAEGCITYQAEILQDYANGDPVLANDIFVNEAVGDYRLNTFVQGEDLSSGSFIVPIISADKVELSSGPYSAGDQIDFQLTLEIPSGDANDVKITDQMPPGVFDYGALNTTFGGADISFDPSSDFQGSTPTVTLTGDNLVLDFGDLSSNTTTPQFIVINLSLTVAAGASGIYNNIMLGNSINSENFPTQTADFEQIIVGASDLEIVKAANVASGDGGDMITYTITLTNSGDAVANNVLVEELPGPEITNCSIISVLDGTGAALAYTNPAGLDIQLTNPIPNGLVTDNSNEVTITLNCELGPDVEAGSQVMNQVMATWSDFSGPKSGMSDPVLVDIDLPTIVKTILGTSLTETTGNQVAPGETIQYQVEITVPEGQSSSAVFADVVPAGLLIQSVDAITADTDLTTSLGTFPAPSPGMIGGGGSNLTINFGDVSNNTNLNDGNTEIITIVYTAIVDPAAGGSEGDSLINMASWDWSTEQITDDEEVILTVPEIEIVKTMTGVVNDLVEISITVSNTSTGPAGIYNLSVSDVLDGSILDVTTVALVSGATGFTFNDDGAGNISIDFDPAAGSPANVLDGGESITFVFTVPVLAGQQFVATSLSNTATVDVADTTPGGGGDLSGPDSTATLDLPALEVEKTVSAAADGIAYQEGETITYTITIVNNGNAALTGIDVSDVVPALLTFVPGSILVNGSSGGSFAAGTVSATIANIPAGGSATVSFDATIDPFTGIITVANQADVSAPGVYTGSEPSDDPTTGPDDDPTEFTACKPADVNFTAVSACSSQGPVCDDCELFVFDASSSADITVTAANGPAASYDVSYQIWNGTSYGAPVTVANGVAFANVTGLTEGLYLFTFEATGVDCVSTGCVSIHTNAVNLDLTNNVGPACGNEQEYDLSVQSNSIDLQYECADGTSGTIPNSLSTYSWSVSPATATFDNASSPTPEITFPISVGGPVDYTVTLTSTDALGCSSTNSVVITQYEPYDLQQTSTLGCGDYLISPEVTITGGNPPWEFEIFDELGTAWGAQQGTQQPDGSWTTVWTWPFPPQPTSGVYTVYANDENDCFTIPPIEVEIYEPFALELDPCVGNAIEFLYIVGGRDPQVQDFTGATYDITISPDPNGVGTVSVMFGDPLPTFTGLTPGPYTVTVTDGNGCGETLPVTVIDPIVSSLTVNPVPCADLNTFSIEHMGGAAPYDFYVMPFGTAVPPGNPSFASAPDLNGVKMFAENQASGLQTFTDVPAGSYTLYTIDQSECSELDATVEAYDALSMTVSADACDFINSVLVETAVGGRDPNNSVGGGFAGAAYNIYLSTNDIPADANDVTNDQGSLSNAGQFTGVAAGSYFVILEDDRGCKTSVPVTVTEGASLTVNPVDCSTGTNSASITAAGGVPDFDFYLYTQGSAFDAANPTNPAAGWIASDLGDGSGSDFAGDFSGVPAGTYTVYAVDDTGCPPVSETVEVFDALTLIQTPSAACVYGELLVSASGGVDPGNYVYSISPNIDVDGATVGSNSTGSFQNLPAGAYTVTVDNPDATCQTTASFNVDFAPVTFESTATCLDLTEYEVVITFTGGTSYIVDDGIGGVQNGIAAGTLNLGPYPGGTSYTITYTSEDDLTCVETFTGSEICFTCNLVADAVATCNSLSEYDLDLNITGDGTYTVTETGGAAVLNNVTAGTYPLGAFANETNYAYTITSDIDPTCTQDVNGTEDCFTCDLTVNATEICAADGLSFTVELTLAGTGTYSVDDGMGGVQNAQSAGVLTFGPFANETTYSYTVTSEVETDCFASVSGDRDCFECDLSADIVTTCDGLSQFNFDLNIFGGGTYTVFNAAGGVILNSVTAGTYSYGPFPNGTSYNWTVVSDEDDTCTELLMGTEDCFICDLTTSVVENCAADGLSFTVDLTIGGTGTYTVDDGMGGVTNGVSAGVLTFGPFANETAYSYTITSEVETDCEEVVSGMKDCFECDLMVNAVPLCDGLAEYNVDLVITGTGTFTVTDASGATVLTSVLAGTYPFGPFDNETTYSYTVVSDEETTCTETVSGTEDCFECDLMVSAVENCAADGLSFTVDVTIAGTGTYTVNDGMGGVTNNVTAGVLNFGPFANETAYSYTVTSDVEEDCEEVVSGMRDCFECDLTINALPVCLPGNLTFEVQLTITGTGTYTVLEGGVSQTGVTAGNLVFGPYDNEEIYSITVTSEEDVTCEEIATGTEDCFECDLMLSTVPVCLDQNSFDVDLIVTGTGTYIIDDGSGNPPLTGQPAGTYTIGSYLNNVNYNFTVTSEEDPTCEETATGTEDCFDCDLVVSAVPQCDGVTGFDVSLTITGTGTFAVLQGTTVIYPSLSAGTFFIGPFPNESTVNYTIESNDDPTCFENISVTEDCFECNLSVSANPVCNDEFSFDVQLTITGDGTFTVDDGAGGTTSVSAAGTFNFGPYLNNENYTFTVTSDLDDECVEVATGTRDCFECDLSASATPNCISLTQYELLLSVAGTGTFTISTGSGVVATGVAAGNFTFGPFNNDAIYNYTITSDEDPTCEEVVSGTEFCYECELTASASTECLNEAEFNVILTVTDLGTFTISDASGNIEVAASTGTFVYGPFANDSVYAFTVTSDIDPECVETFTGTEDCYECDLGVSVETVCSDDLATFDVNLTVTGLGTFTISDASGAAIQTGVPAGTFNFPGFANEAQYNYTVTSDLDPLCTETVAGTEDCFECDLSVSANAVCDGFEMYDLNLVITGQGTFTVSDGSGVDVWTNVPAGTYVTQDLPNNFIYTFTVVSDLDEECEETVTGTEDCFDCDLTVNAVTECEGVTGFNVTLNVAGTGTYDIVDASGALIQGGVSAGSYPLGFFANDSTFTYTVTSVVDSECTETVTGTDDCFECDLNLSVNEFCEGNLLYFVDLSLEGSGTYTVSSGTTNETGVTAGNISFGPFESESDYSITVVSELDPECTETVSGMLDCYECELQVTAVPECDGPFAYFVTLTIVGDGPFDVLDINGPDQTLEAGTYTFGPYDNGVGYGISVTSVFEPECTESVQGVEDCFECELQVSANPVCIDEFTFGVDVVITGPGTYTLDDGTTVTTVSEGTYNFPSYENEEIYTFTVTSTEDPECQEIVTGTEDCFDCELTVSAVTECLEDQTGYLVLLTINGGGTYTVSGTEPTQTGVTAGVLTFGPYANQTDYAFTVTSEEDPECEESVNGTEDCFECELEASLSFECLEDLSGYTVFLTITGPGTYVVFSPETNTTEVGITAGTYTYGPVDNGATLSFDITSEIEQDCETAVSITEDCFECDLQVSPIEECVGSQLDLGITITGSGTYTIVSSAGTQMGVTAGTYSIDFYPDGTQYSVTVTSEAEPECSETISGIADCFECELEISAAEICFSPLGFDVDLLISGNGTYTVTSGGTTVTGVNPGTYSFGPYENNEVYNFTVASELDPECIEEISGTRDCFECDLSVNPIATCDGGIYTLELVVAGSGTFTILEDNENPQTGLPEGSYFFGPYLSLEEYSIQVINEEDESCFELIEGSEECYECDLSLATAVNCIDENEFNVIVTITGDGTFALNSDADDLTGIPAGNYTIGPFENGDWNIEVISELDPECIEVASGTEDCEQPFVCDLSADIGLECDGLNSYFINVSFTAVGGYTINIEAGGESFSTFVTGGVSETYGPYPNGPYDVEIISEIDPTCISTNSGSFDCSETETCNFSAVATEQCITANQFQVQITITGSGTYSIIDDENPPMTGLTQGTYTTGLLPIDNGYAIIVSNESIDDCAIALSGNPECSDDPNCDLEVVADFTCDDNSSFTGIVQIFGSASYTLEDMINPPITGLVAGDIINVGPYNSDYLLTITNDENPGCYQNIQGIKNCNAEAACDISTNVTKTCEGTDGYTVNIEIFGPNLYTVYLGLFAGGPPDPDEILGENLTAGSYTFGPFENGATILTVLDQVNEGCFQDMVIEFNCDAGNFCDLNANIEVICEADGNYSIDLTIEGTGEFAVLGGVSQIVSGTPPTTINIEFDAGDTYFIPIEGIGNPECSQDFLGTPECDQDVPCNLEASFETICFEEGEPFFDGTLNITTIGVYEVFDPINGLTIVEGPGSYYLGVFQSGNYNIVLSEIENPDCSIFIEGATLCAPIEECDLIANAIPTCFDEDSYTLDLNIQGSGSYDLFVNGEFQGSGFTAGDYPIGPLPNGPYEIQIVDPNSLNECSRFILATFNCQEEGVCDLAIDVERYCYDEDNFFVKLTITGTGTYTAEWETGGGPFGGNDSGSIPGLEAGVEWIGPIPTGQFEITVFDESNEDCSLTTSFSYSCFDIDPCEAISTTQLVCQSDGSLVVEMDIAGEGLYNVIINEVVYLDAQPAGSYTLGPISQGEYTINLSEVDNLNCYTNTTGVFECGETEDCFLTVLNATPICESADSDFFSIEFEIEGNGLYQIFNNGNLVDQDVEPGIFVVEDIINGFYQIQIIDQTDDRCQEGLFGTYSCDEDGLTCELTADIQEICDGPNGFLVEVTIEGPGTFNVISDTHPIDDIVTEGSYVYGPVEPDGFISITVFGAAPGCEIRYWATRECDLDIPCDLFVTADPICNDDGTFNLLLEIEGSSTYSITEWFNDQVPLVTIDGQEAVGLGPGVYEFVGPFPNNGGSAYDILITDDQTNGLGPNGPCWQNLWADFFCDVIPPCNLFATITDDCVDGGLELSMNLTGSSNYTVQDGFFGTPLLENVPAGVYDLPTPPFGDYQVFVIDNNNGNCFQAINGTNDCVVPPCDLVINADSPVCLPDDSGFTIEIFIQGPNTYQLEYLGQTITGLSEGPQLLEGFTLGYNITVTDETNLGCTQTLSNFSYSCTPVPPCDVEVNVEVNCISDTEYNAVVNVEGSGIYDLFGGFITDIGLPAGTYEYGPFESNQGTFDLFVQQQNDITGNCFDFTQVGTDCQGLCDLNTSFEEICNDDGTLTILMTIEGSGLFDVQDFNGDFLTDFEAGVYEFGPYDNQYGFQVISQEFPDFCFESTFGNGDCVPLPPCDLFAAGEPLCQETGGYLMQIELSGSSTYQIFEGFSGTFLSGLEAGVYEIPLSDGQYNFQIFDEINFNCSTFISGNQECPGGPGGGCSLFANIDTTICVGNGSFDYIVVLEVTGADTYNIDAGFGPPQFTNVPAGTYEVGPLNNGNYEIEVTQAGDDDCFQILNGAVECDPVDDGCEIDGNVRVICNADGSYSMEVTIVGNQNYSVFEGQGGGGNPLINNQPEGVYIIDGFDEPEYNITIQQIGGFGGPGCNFNYQGTGVCSVAPPCDLSYLYDTECIDGEYTINLTIGGSALYTINDGLGTATEGAFLLTYQTDNWPEENSWQLINAFTGAVVETGIGSSYPQNQEVSVLIDGLDPFTDYIFQAFDSFGDGWTGGPIQFFDPETGALLAEEFFAGDVLEIFLGLPATTQTPTFVDVPAGTYQLGPYSDPDFEIFIQSSTDTGCFALFNGSENCFDLPPTCTLEVSATDGCMGDDEFIVELVLTGTSTYTIEYDGGPMTGQTAGTIPIGPLGDGAYSITIFDENDPTCSRVISGFKTCPEVAPVCNLTADFGEPICNEDGTYSILFSFVGTSTYEIIDGVNPTIFGATEGTYVAGPYLSGAFYSINIIDEDDSLPEICFRSTNGSHECDPPPPLCDLDVNILSAVCDGDALYTVSIEITGTGLYEVQVGTQTISNVAAGTYDIPVSVNVAAYTIIVTDQTNATCTESVNGLNPCDTPPDCEILATADDICINGGGYFVNLDVTATGTFSVDDGMGSVLSNQTSGDIVLGPYEVPSYSITITLDEDDCDPLVINGDSPCPLEPPTCDFTAEVTVVCTGDNLYVPTVTITGSGNNNIFNGVVEVLTDVPAGTYILPEATGTNYVITVINDNVNNCNDTFTGPADCVLPDCDLVVSTNDVCDLEGNSFIDVIVETTGTVFITNGLEVTAGLAAGTYQFGPLDGGDYDLTITSETFDDCAENVTGNVPCEDVTECNIIASDEVICEDGGQFSVNVNVLYAATVSITDVNTGVTTNGLNSGTYNFGPYSGSDYELIISADDLIGCGDTLTGSAVCPVDCDFIVSDSVICLPDGSFNVEVEVLVAGTFGITGSGGTDLSGLTAGTYLLGPITGNDYNFRLTHEELADCEFLFDGMTDCPQPLCDLDATFELECQPDGTYNVLLSTIITGSYEIPELGLTGLVAGDTTVGPITEGSFAFTLVHEQVADCEFEIASGTECQQPTCDFDLNNVVQNCAPDGLSYTIDLDVSVTGSYAIPSLGESGLVSGVITLGPFTDELLQIELVHEQIDDCSFPFEGNFTCEPPVCDLTASFSSNCAADGVNYTATLDVSLTGSYSIPELGIVNQTSGLIDLGSFEEGAFTATLVHDQIADCIFPINEVVECADVPCDLNVLYTVNCSALGDSYTVDINASLTGTYSIPSIGVLNQSAGVLTVGPFTDATLDLLLVHDQIENCLFSVQEEVVCDPPACEFTTVIAVPTCDPLGGQYEVALTVEVAGTYSIPELGIFNQASGTINLGTFTNPQLSFILQHDQFDDCTAEVNEVVDCPVPPCTIDPSYEVICNPDGTNFEVLLSVDLIGTYSIPELGLAGLDTSTISLGIFDEGEFGLLLVHDQIPDCTTNIGETVDCPDPVCDLEATATVLCNPDGTNFMLTLDVTITGSYSIPEWGVENAITGEVTIGPFDDGAYSVSLIHDQVADCSFEVAAENDCPDPQCNFELGASTTTCLNTGDYMIDLEVTLDGSYSVPEFGLTGLTSGTLSVGPVSSADYAFTLVHDQIADCSETIEGVGPDCQPPLCDIIVTESIISCSADGSEWSIDLSFTVTGTVSLTGGDMPMTGLESGTYTLGPFTDSQYQFTLNHDQVENCSEVILGEAVCEPFNCDFSINLNALCNDDESLMVSVLILGEGNFTIDNGEGVILTGQPAGVVMLPNVAGPNFEATVYPDGAPQCALSESGFLDCGNEECAWESSHEVICASDGSFTVAVDIDHGDNVFTFINGDEIIADLTSGSYVFGPYEGNSFEFNFNSETTGPEPCAYAIIGDVDCPADPVCDLTVDVVATCIGDGEYTLNITIDGTGVYSLDAGTGLLSDLTAGTYEITPPMPANEYTVTVTDQLLFTCVKEVGGLINCSESCSTEISNASVNEEKFCEGEVLDCFAEFAGVDPTYETGYFLYTDPADPIGSAIAFSTDGSFINDGTLPMNTEMYAGAAALPAPFGTSFEGECVNVQAIALQESIVFFEPIVIAREVICNEEEGEWSVNFLVTGGAAEYFNAEYDFFGSEEGVTENKEVTIGPFPGDVLDSYSLTFGDDEGCLKSFAEDSINCAGALALTLLEFDGRVEDIGNLLFWTTASENETKEFTVERSLDGFLFEEIGSVEADGYSNTDLAYQLMDYNAPLGYSYYRLLETDFAGTTKVASQVVALRREAEGDITIIGAYPVPTLELVTITVETVYEAQVPVRVFDVSGKLVQSFSFNTLIGENKIVLDVRSYPAGTYLVQMTLGDEQESIRIIKD